MSFQSKHFDPAILEQAKSIIASSGVKFAHLHAHSTFSFLDGYGTGKQIAERIVELGQTSCAMTDHGNIVSHVPVGKDLIKAEINPVYGCEFYICEDMKQKGRHCPSLPYEVKKNGPGPLPHITVLAKTQKGYENLLALSTASFREGFHHKPRIDHKILVEKQEGLVVLSGCPGGWPSRMLELGMAEQAWSLMYWLSTSIENYYIEVTPSPGYDVSHRVTDTLFEWGKALNRPVVMTADAHFPKPEDHEAQDLLLAVGLRTTIYDKTRELRLPDYQFYCGAEDILARSMCVCTRTDITEQLQAIQNAATIADSCRVEIPKGKMVAFPKIPDESTAEDLLVLICSRGFVNKCKLGQIPEDQKEIYWNRLCYEIDILSRKGFCDYILAVWDIVLYVKSKGGLVNLRGSAGGSMILWLTGCSVTDPIYHGLSFERFYDDTRFDPPDVDIDFEKTSRPSAISYAAETYGKDNVAQIAGLSQMKGRGALQNLCSGLGIPISEFRPYSEKIEHESAEKSVLIAIQPLIEKYPKIGELLPKVMGQLKTTTVHAAGVLISAEPLSKCVGIMSGGEGQPVASVDKRGASHLGLLKMDFLNVQALDVVGQACRSISEISGLPNIDWLYSLPLNDPKVYATARAGMLAGVFQLDGRSAVRVANEIIIDDFDDLVAASVLCRPGPIENVSLYRNHKQDAEALKNYLSRFTPSAANIVKDTYGVLMYQEQVMRIAREVAGLDWKTVHKLRKEVGDKAGLDAVTGDEWRREWKEIFTNGCIQTSGMTKEEAEGWWNQVETHGGYSFNKSHGVSYGIVGYWMLWLKTYWPAQFYESFLKLESDNEYLRKRLILEFKKLGGVVDLLDPIESRESFRAVGSGRLVGGYQDVRGIGPKTAEKITAMCPFTSMSSMLDSLPKAASLLISSSRFWDKENCDPAAIAILAPWFPIPGMPQADLLELTTRGIAACGYLTDEPFDSVTVGGYVTSKEFKGNKISLTIEDPWGMALVRVAKRFVNGPLGAKFREVKPGDLIGVDGWWTGDCLFAKDVAVLKTKS